MFEMCGFFEVFCRHENFKISSLAARISRAVFPYIQISLNADTYLQVCSTCNRNQVPAWLLDANGRAVLPGSIVRCSRDMVQYVPPPPPVEPVEASTSPRTNKGKSSVSTASSPRTAQRAIAANNMPPTSPRRAGGAPRRFPSSPRRSPRAGTQQASQKTSPSRRVVVPSSPRSPRRGVIQVSTRDGRSPSNGDASLSKVRNNIIAPLGTPNTRRGVKKGREQTLFELAAATAKSNFESQSGECMVMIVVVHGVRPRPPRTARSLEGYCIMVGWLASL